MAFDLVYTRSVFPLLPGGSESMPEVWSALRDSAA